MLGAYGGVATTLVVGARAIAAGMAPDTGVATSGPAFSGLGLVAVGDLVFGGHDLRESDFATSARQIAKASGALDLDLVDSLRDDLLAISDNVRRGTAINCGPAISELVGGDVTPTSTASLREVLGALRGDLREFRAQHELEHVVVVNMASTEPDLAEEFRAIDLAGLEAFLDADRTDAIRPSLLYAYAAFREGCGFLNFTPSSGALTPALQQLARQLDLPFMGSDGKTGETLVKSALAPMFAHRHLQVLSWQGYNILGDRDGQVLAHEDNLASKVRSKDSVLASILGYDFHSHVGIDYVPSIDDRKTAWDHIHFAGFLGHKMTMQFIWQGCDAILAAPLVLDMVRLTDLALRRGESGPMPQLGAYFKSPLDVKQQDLHEQMRSLYAYVRARSDGAD